MVAIEIGVAVGIGVGGDFDAGLSSMAAESAPPVRHHFSPPLA